ncbi:MAG: hypothetical protein ACT6QS_05210 [Flavobacteriales bacterium]
MKPVRLFLLCLVTCVLFSACDPVKQEEKLREKKKAEFLSSANGSWLFSTLEYKTCGTCPLQDHSAEMQTIRIQISYPDVTLYETTNAAAEDEVLNQGVLLYSYPNLPLNPSDPETAYERVHALKFSFSKPHYKTWPLPDSWYFKEVHPYKLVAYEEGLPYSSLILIKP